LEARKNIQFMWYLLFQFVLVKVHHRV